MMSNTEKDQYGADQIQILEGLELDGEIKVYRI